MGSSEQGRHLESPNGASKSSSLQWQEMSDRGVTAVVVVVVVAVVVAGIAGWPVVAGAVMAMVSTSSPVRISFWVGLCISIPLDQPVRIGLWISISTSLD